MRSQNSTARSIQPSATVPVPSPINDLVPILQEQLPGKTLSTELVNSDDKLLAGLRNHLYQMVVLHHCPEDKDLFCQRYLDEQLYISIAKNHPLAKQDSVTFEELKGLRILMTAHVGFWMDVTLEKLNASDLLIQNSMDALGGLIDASSLPFFNSDQMLKAGYQPPDRVALPITDPEAHTTYWITCLASEQQKYRSVFSAVRGNLLRNQS